MSFDTSRYQQEFSIPKKISVEPAGHMFLYEALLTKVDRLDKPTAELSLKLVWYHKANRKPRTASIHCFASILQNQELTDFAKIVNQFLPEDQRFTEQVELHELVAMASGIVKAINRDELFCYCYIDSKQRIGKKLKRFEMTDTRHPILTREYCDAIKGLDWFIPEKYAGEPKFKMLAELDRKRNWKIIGGKSNA